MTASVPSESPPWKVEVAVEEVALKVEAAIYPPATKFLVTSRTPEKVEEAVVVTESAPAKVLVAVVEVAVKYEVFTVSATTNRPPTPKVVPGVVVPTPTKPLERMVKAVEVAFKVGSAKTLIKFRLERDEVAEMVKRADWVVKVEVPIPRKEAIEERAVFETVAIVPTFERLNPPPSISLAQGVWLP